MSASSPCETLALVDLLDDTEKQSFQQRLSVYTTIGYEVISTSAKVSHGLDALINCLHNQTSIFVGQSGVGKSSLINQLLPDANARIGDISTATNKGRHTTTTAWLYHLLDNQGAIIDSPGIREFGLWQISADRLADGFREFTRYAQQCKFRNCLHLNEPACAVRDAVANNQLNHNRYESYLRILASLQEGLG